MSNILIVDDEENILQLVKFNLEREGYKTVLAKNGEIALEKVRREDINLIILDIMLPKMNGYDICRKLKADKDYRKVPIIFLSAKNAIDDIIEGLNLGATDYLSKPFSPRELVSRIKTIFRREKDGTKKSVIQVGEVSLDLDKYQAIFNRQQVELTYKEFSLLKLLLQNKEQVYSREKLLEAVWGEDSLTMIRTIDVHIRNLRKKFKQHGVHKIEIETIRGVGYRLNF